jgi:hypothetical protein
MFLLGFFDNYIIPLAKKLKDCNIFGVSSDECLNYAVMNRAEWVERGEQITEEMVEEITKELELERDGSAAQVSGDLREEGMEQV